MGRRGEGGDTRLQRARGMRRRRVMYMLCGVVGGQVRQRPPGLYDCDSVDWWGACCDMLLCGHRVNLQEEEGEAGGEREEEAGAQEAEEQEEEQGRQQEGEGKAQGQGRQVDSGSRLGFQSLKKLLLRRGAGPMPVGPVAVDRVPYGMGCCGTGCLGEGDVQMGMQRNLKNKQKPDTADAAKAATAGQPLHCRTRTPSLTNSHEVARQGSAAMN